jgi:PHP family Zn ribbon phosphoesterase
MICLTEKSCITSSLSRPRFQKEEECSNCGKKVEKGILEEFEAIYEIPVCPFCFQDPKGDRK